MPCKNSFQRLICIGFHGSGRVSVLIGFENNILHASDGFWLIDFEIYRPEEMAFHIWRFTLQA